MVKVFRIRYVKNKSSKLPERDTIDVMAPSLAQSETEARKELKKKGIKHVRIENIKEIDPSQSELNFNFETSRNLKLIIKGFRSFELLKDGTPTYQFYATLNGIAINVAGYFPKEDYMKQFGLTSQQFDLLILR